MSILMMPFDVIKVIIKDYIRNSDDFRNLSLSCKLFAEICRKNKYIYSFKITMDNDVYVITDSLNKRLVTPLKIIFKSKNYIFKIKFGNRFVYNDMTIVKMNLYTHGMVHLFVQYLFMSKSRISYDYEWGNDYQYYKYHDGYYFHEKYYYNLGRKNGNMFHGFTSESQMPFVNNLNIKFELSNNFIDKFSYENNIIKLTLNK